MASGQKRGPGRGDGLEVRGRAEYEWEGEDSAGLASEHAVSLWSLVSFDRDLKTHHVCLIEGWVVYQDF